MSAADALRALIAQQALRILELEEQLGFPVSLPCPTCQGAGRVPSPAPAFRVSTEHGGLLGRVTAGRDET